MARDFFQATVVLPDATGVVKALSGIKVSVVPRGSSDVANTLVDIYTADTGSVRGPDPKAAATGTHPFITGATGAVRFWAEGPTEYDVVYEDTILPARVADRVGWNCLPAKAGSFSTKVLASDAGIAQKMLSPEVVYQQIPIGGVVDWWRPSLTVAVPIGFEIADGRSITQHEFPNVTGSVALPDLRNAFILGADSNKADGAGASGTSSDAVTDAPGIRGTGGSNAHTLTTSQLATHSHGGATVAGLSGTENTTLSHQHTGGTGGMSGNTSHLHGAAPGYNFIMTPGTSGNVGAQSGGGVVVVAVQLGTTPASGSTTNSTNTDHTHGFTTNAGGPAAHSHNIPALTINPDGSGSAHNNMPKWIGLLKLIKVRRTA
jgi:hypothetical protein